MTDTPKSPDRTVHVKEPAGGGELLGDEHEESETDEGLATDRGPAQADAEDSTMGGSSDGDTAP